MQLFCAAVCFLFTSGAPLQASKLTFGSDSDACYAAFLRLLTETFRGLNSCICALTRNFYSLRMLHYKHGTRLRLRQPCLLRYASLFITKFYVGRYLAPLPFQSGAVLVTLRAFVHLRK